MAEQKTLHDEKIVVMKSNKKYLLTETAMEKQNLNYLAEIGDKINNEINPLIEEMNTRFKTDINDYLKTIFIIESFELWEDCDTETRVRYSIDYECILINVAMSIKLKDSSNDEFNKKHLKHQIFTYIRDKISPFSINNYKQNGYKVYWMEEDEVDNNEWIINFESLPSFKEEVR